MSSFITVYRIQLVCSVVHGACARMVEIWSIIHCSQYISQEIMFTVSEVNVV